MISLENKTVFGKVAGEIFNITADSGLLIAAGNEKGYNTMLAGWAQYGVLWAKKVASVYVRPSRYTFGFMEWEDHFSLNYFEPEFRDKLAICGSKSGRDIDKVSECGFTTLFDESGCPFFAEAKIAVVCKKLYRTDLAREDFVEEEVFMKHYRGGDVHREYIGEVVSVYGQDGA